MGQRWETVNHAVTKNIPVVHALTGKRSNASDENVQDIMRTHFSDLEQLGAPRATRIATSLVDGKDGESATVNWELRDEDQEVIELPSFMSKFGLCNKLLKECGWTHTYDAKARIKDTQKVKSHDTAKRVPSWRFFLEYWNEHHPHLKIPKAAEDICGECYVYANRIRHKQKKTGKRGREAMEADGDDDEQEELLVPAEKIHGDRTEAEEKRMIASELLIEKASIHVNRARAQRNLFNKKKQEAIDTKHLPAVERIYTVVIDYAQNMYLPNFAGEQPGEVYYYSPLNTYVLGIVDASEGDLAACPCLLRI